MRVIVCGGRDFNDRAYVRRVLSEIHAETPIRHLFHGNARGADSCADEWGINQPGVSVHAIPANWKKYGKQAGPVRNKQMLGQSPDLVIAFPGGRGTAHMVKIAEEAGIPVVRPRPLPL